MQNLLQDLRYGLRMMLKKPGFTAVAVITLALGIGANTAIFSVVNYVLLRPLPYPEPDRLVTFWLSTPRGMQDMEWTDQLFAFFRDRNHSFEGLAAYDGTSLTLTGRDRPERLEATTVTYNFFRVMRQEPLYGRTFLPTEDLPGNNNVVILSHQIWQRRFAADPAIVGQSINLNNVPTVVVGVMRPGFDFPDHSETWVPVGLNPEGPNETWYLEQVGRLKPGVTITAAQREMSALYADYALERKWPKDESGTTLIVRPLSQEIVHDVQTPLLVLSGAVGLVLLIACANIANLLLARAISRRHEMALRGCLGASTFRIVRQLLTESLLLALSGAGGGLLLAFWFIDALRSSSVEIPRLDQVRINSPVLLFTAVVTLLTGLLFGLVPALRSARVNVQESLKEGSRGSAPASHRRVNNAFVIAQFALSLMLLIGAGLLLQSFKKLTSVDPGFKPENVLTARIELPEKKYTDDTQIRGFYQRLLERVQGLPGVRSAGLSSMVPFGSSGDGNVFTVEGQDPDPDKQLPVAWWRDVTPDYFSAMGIPLLKGRTFRDIDNKNGSPVAIVDEKLANTYWPNQDPIGKRIRWGRASWGNSLMTVVGVVARVKHRRLDEDAKFYLYQPASQEIVPEMYVAVRTTSNPETLTAALRRQVSDLDPELPLFEVRTMDQAVATSLSTRRLTNILLAGFAATALLLAAIGIYGVTSLNVTGRIHEFGIRIALGATRRDVLSLAVFQGLRLALIGLVFGIGGALLITRFMSSLLFGVSATDPWIFAGVALLLALVALLACYIPARRAMKVDPLVALRYE
ncbi:MAG TPA: ABC transporter permease [Pyrinomonadaceae bacterium]|jgi:putative ABC transport system permease protein